MTIDPEGIDETAGLLANVLSTRLINAVVADTEGAGLRFKDLADRMNVSPPGVTNILRSVNLKLSTAVKLSLAMGKGLRLLYGDELIDTDFGPAMSDYLDAECGLADGSDGLTGRPEPPSATGGGAPRRGDGRFVSFTVSVNGSAYERTYETHHSRTDGLEDDGDELARLGPEAGPGVRQAASGTPASRDLSWQRRGKVNP